jgi:hypothetical protein
MACFRVCSLGVLLALALSGCDSPSAPVNDGGTDAWVGNDAAPMVDAWTAPDAWMFAPADHGPAPIIPDQHGRRFAHPQLVIITFADEPNRAAIEAHASWLVGSNWLTTVGADYGIGSGTILQNVHRTDNAPDSIAQTAVEQLLVTGLTDHSLPTAADGTFEGILYVLYFPTHTHITDPMFGDSCRAYGGYHFEGMAGGLPFSYAVVPSCPGFNPSLADAESEQEAAAHEIIEAATNARPRTAPAFSFSQTSIDLSPWIFIGGEVADLCALRVGNTSYVRESGFVASRVWSNSAAMANDRDPCIPDDPTAPYTSVSISPANVVFAPAGSTTHFDLVVWSTAPAPAETLYAAPYGGTFTATVSVDRMSVVNGDHATLSVGVPAGTPSNAYGIVYVGLAHSPSDYQGFPVVVVAQ